MNIYLASWLKDNDPYVRKTVAICVAKIYDINSELVEDRGFLDALKDLISNNNPMVVANVVAALAKIQESSEYGYFDSPTPISKSGASSPASTANARHPAARLLKEGKTPEHPQQREEH
ncbi:hypothetical protein BC332_28053 [Capsicum chinense]|nr:hypothetical protein BC332_28053 [Capsicum chinense]